MPGDAQTGNLAGTVVAETDHCEIRLALLGFYILCTSGECGFLEGPEHAKYRALRIAETHDATH